MLMLSKSIHLNQLFVYGTLMAPEVVEKLIHRIPIGKPATLLRIDMDDNKKNNSIRTNNSNSKSNNNSNNADVTSTTTGFVATTPLSIDPDDDTYIYRRYPVLNAVYPGLIAIRKKDEITITPEATTETTATVVGKPQPLSTTRIQGFLYDDLTVDEMTILDTFEGDQYTKYNCYVRMGHHDYNPDHSESTSCVLSSCAFIYLWTYPVELLDIQPSPPNNSVTSTSTTTAVGDWSYEKFRQYHLQQYIENI